MITKYKTKQLKLNADILGKKAGSKMSVKVDDDGNPIDPQVRKYLKDAEFDKCCELAGNKNNTTTEKGKTK